MSIVEKQRDYQESQRRDEMKKIRRQAASDRIWKVRALQKGCKLVFKKSSIHTGKTFVTIPLLKSTTS